MAGRDKTETATTVCAACGEAGPVEAVDGAGQPHVGGDLLCKKCGASRREAR